MNIIPMYIIDYLKYIVNKVLIFFHSFQQISEMSEKFVLAKCLRTLTNGQKKLKKLKPEHVLQFTMAQISSLSLCLLLVSIHHLFFIVKQAEYHSIALQRGTLLTASSSYVSCKILLAKLEITLAESVELIFDVDKQNLFLYYM